MRGNEHEIHYFDRVRVGVRYYRALRRCLAIEMLPPAVWRLLR